jgi:trimethylamine--corrinoid protein Co-methyltransferase
MTRRGLEGGQYKPLTTEDIAKIHATSMRVLAEVGVQVNSSEARELFKKAGATVSSSANIMTFPEEVVKAAIKTAPSMVNLAGRDDSGALDCTIGGKKVYLGTGGTALNVQDPGKTEVRPSQLKDVMNMARCVEALDNIHFYMLNVYPNDLRDDDKAVDVNRFGAALNKTRKHVMGGVYTVNGVRNVIKMAEMIAGSPEKLRERPFISMVTCLVSPFKMDELYSTLTMEVARQGIPVVVPAEPLCGATAPITLAGNLVIQNVDSLSGIMLAQLTNPGTPSIYGCISSITDLSDMKYLSGAVEMGMMNAAAAQMAQFYKLPYYATAGMTDAKVSDAQAGYESGIGSLMAALSGANFIHDAAGFIEFCMTASYEKLVR